MMPTYYFAEIGADEVVLMQHAVEWGGEGPPAPPDVLSGSRMEPLTTAIMWAGQTRATQKCVWNAGAVEWVETASLAELKPQAIADVDAFGDSVRLAVVGHAARIKEYEDAQRGAEQYRDAGYTGPVPDPVASWAHAKRRDGWTDRQAADDILAASARWYAALRGIRAMRLDAKETIRAAATGQEVATIVATFRATLTAAMQGVQ